MGGGGGGGAWGGLGGSAPPQQKIKLKSCPTKPKFALADFNHFLPKLQMTLLFFKITMPFLKKKTNNPDIFAVVPMLICEWQTFFGVVKFTYSKKIDISVFSLKF